MKKILKTSQNMRNSYVCYSADCRIARISHSLEEKKPVKTSQYENSFEFSKMLCRYFKNLVENNKGYELLYSENGEIRSEKIVQRAFLLAISGLCELYSADISPESNAGRGPVDFKISFGADKTVIEIKLTSNQDTLHGFDVQIEEYAKAEKTDNKIFMMIDDGKHVQRVKSVNKSYEERLAKGENPATIICIDARKKEPASKY